MTQAIKINVNDGKITTTATGGETEIDFDFPIFEDTHVKIFKTSVDGLTLTELVKDTGFTVPSGSVNQQAGGTVDLTVAAVAGEKYTAFLGVPNSRTTDFNDAGDFFADALNKELDLIAQQMQQVTRDLARAPLLREDSTLASLTFPAASANTVIKWNSAGTALENGPTATQIENAETNATSAAASAASAASLLTQIQGIYDDFDDRYLGVKSSDPTVDNDGDALEAGALYYNSTTADMRVYDLNTTTWLILNVTIANNSIDNTKIADMAQATIKGRASGGGTGDPQDLTAAQVRTIIGNSTTTQSGLVEKATTAEMTAGTADKFPDASDVKAYFDNNSASITLLTEQATTSGTTKTFTIPSGANRVTVMFDEVSVNSNVIPLIQLGDSGGVETTGYVAGVENGGSGTGSTSSTVGFPVVTSGFANAGSNYSGSLTLTRMDGNKWVAQGGFFESTFSGASSVAGVKELSAELTTIQINGNTGTFDNGNVNVLWE